MNFPNNNILSLKYLSSREQKVVAHKSFGKVCLRNLLPLPLVTKNILLYCMVIVLLVM